MGNSIIDTELHHLGSTIIIFTSSGLDLKMMLIIRVLIHTDLPEPVAPAMSRWGIFSDIRHHHLAADILAHGKGQT